MRGHKQARVLDLGCGGGHVSFAVAPEVGEVVAYDLSAEMLTAVTRAAVDRGLDNLRTECGAAETLPFADASFDIVLTRYSAHHWRDLDAALKEARRVIRPTGFAVFADAASPGEPLRDTFLQTIEMLRDPSHVRDYTVAEWEAMLAAAGFTVTATRAMRLRLDFTSWIARMRTPPVFVEAIRALQAVTSAEVREHFAVEEDGTFTLDTAVFVAKR